MHEQSNTKSDHGKGTLTTARGINNHGDIVGAYSIGGPGHAMLLKKGKFIPLAPTTILGTIYSEATNINDHGDIVGQMIDDNGFAHGFLLSDGVLTILGVARNPCTIRAAFVKQMHLMFAPN